MSNDIEAKLENPPWVVLAQPGNKKINCWRVYTEMKPGEERDRTTYTAKAFQPRENSSLTTHFLVESHFQSGRPCYDSSLIQTKLLNIIDTDVIHPECKEQYAKDCCARYARQDAANLAKSEGMIAVEIDKDGNVLGFVR